MENFITTFEIDKILAQNDLVETDKDFFLDLSLTLVEEIKKHLNDCLSTHSFNSLENIEYMFIWTKPRLAAFFITMQDTLLFEISRFYNYDTRIYLSEYNCELVFKLK